MMSFSRIAFAALMSVCSLAQAASFDCAKARSTREKLICGDSALSALDEKLNAAYNDAIARTGNKGLVRHWQRDWLRSWQLGACKDAACVRPQFVARIAALDAAVDSPWNGQYIRYAGNKVDRHAADIMLIAGKDGSVTGAGSALWLGANAAKGQVNTGEFDAVGSFTGDALIFEQDSCHVRILRQDDVLQVEDSGQCGGHNVSFGGSYRRKAF
jgi:uncharacterized protein